MKTWKFEHLFVVFAVGMTLTAGVSSYSPAHSAAGDDESVPNGELELLIRGPDSRPVKEVEVRVIATDPLPPRDRTPRQASSRTDSAGVARFAWPVGVGRVNVAVSGVGYGATGVFEVTSGRPVRPPLASLVPFVVLEGTVPKEITGTNLCIKPSGPGQSLIPKVSVGEGGKFRVEVPAGRWWLQVADGSERIANVTQSIIAIPGMTISDISFQRIPPEQRNQNTTSIVLRPGMDQKEASWVSGTVRDGAGKPVVGAKVWAYAVYNGGIRMAESVKQSTTDSAGRYEIKGEGGLSTFSASIVAHIPGKPPAWAWIQENDRDISAPVGTPIPPAPPGPTVDLTIPDQGGRLDVTVVQDGKPVAGAMVGLWQEGVNLRDTWAKGGGSPEQIEIEKIVHPVKAADATGVVSFDSLLPGRYRVIAARGDENRVRVIQANWRRNSPGPFGIASGVPVRVAQTTSYQLGIYAQRDETEVRVFRPDGRPLTGNNPFNYRRVASQSITSSGQTLDANGLGQLQFDSPGLWQVDFKYRDTPTRTIPISGAPYYAAEGVVAVSSLLPPAQMEPARLTVRKFEPGTVMVELKDLAGRPAKGFVELVSGGSESYMTGSTDENGVIRFEGVHEWKYQVRGYLAGRQPNDLGVNNFPLPDEKVIQGTTAVLAELVNVEPNTEKRIVLREQTVGYVMGTVKPAANHKTNEYFVFLDETSTAQGALVHHRQSTGEYVAGPFAPREAQILVRSFRDNTAKVSNAKIEAGKVTRIDIAPPAESARPLAGRGNMLIGAGGASYLGTGAGGLTGRVFLPGGMQPALAATVMYFEPGRWEPVLGGMTDARGQIRAKGLWHSGNKPTSKPTDDPPGPLLVAFLPGSHGAAMVPPPQPGKPLEIVLPATATIRGRVTVAGAVPTGMHGSLRVFAAYEGKGSGRVGGLLSVQTTAQEDGSFELAGLTPGRYSVQASLDDIWLSLAVVNEVTDRQSAQMTLAIPAPGGAVIVKVVDAEGKPRIGQTVTIDRPAGPLATMLWPLEWKTDGAGEVRFPALEAGRHTVRVKDTNASAELVIKPLPSKRAVELLIRIGANGGR